MRPNRLIQLLSDNRRPYAPMGQRIAQKAGSSEATVYLYDAIVSDRVTAEWFGGVCPQDFVPAFRAIEASTIHLRVNSPGGDVFGAEPICKAIRDHGARVIAHVEGLAASAATVVTSACDEVLITPNSKYMIHESWSLAWGNKRDLRALSDLLEKCDASMYDAYARFTGNDLVRIAAWCEDETWFSADEAVQHGFASALDDASAAKAQARAPHAPQAAWRLEAYQHAPAGLQASAHDLAPSGDLLQQPGGPAPEAALAIPAELRQRITQRLRAAQLLQPVE